MDNHYHLLLETHNPNLSAGMRHLNGLYTQRFNHQHHRVGHLFQGRFKAILVEKESYLLELCRYVVLNPVRAGLVQDPSQWPWSSYRALAGETEVPRWLSADWVLRQFDAHRKSAQQKYKAFVLEGLRNISPWGKLRGQIYLGSEEFCKRFAQDEPLAEIPKLQRQPVRLTLEEIRNSLLKNPWWRIWLASIGLQILSILPIAFWYSFHRAITTGAKNPEAARLLFDQTSGFRNVLALIAIIPAMNWIGKSVLRKRGLPIPPRFIGWTLFWRGTGLAMLLIFGSAFALVLPLASIVSKSMAILLVPLAIIMVILILVAALFSFGWATLRASRSTSPDTGTIN